MVVVYGLKNCDTCRKAVAWLNEERIAHSFVDLRKDGFEIVSLSRWINELGWEVLLNSRSTTWRNLPGSKTNKLNAKKARALMWANPSLIKRPVFEIEGRHFVGFKEEQKAEMTAGQLSSKRL